MDKLTNKKLAFIAWTIALCIVACVAAGAAGITPGSEGDPVVTKSYVDERIGEVMQSVSSGSSSAISNSLGSEELLAQIEYVVKTQIQKEQGPTFTPVSVEMGQTIFGGEGCEMVLRSGAGFIVTSTDTVVNATSGVDLKNGAAVSKGHLLIFPRDDGRGVKASDRCWFIVKGNYTIK